MKKKLAIVLSAIMAIGVIGSVSFSPAVSVSAEESNSEFENPVYDEATDTTDYDYAYFGMYPTSEVTGDALTDEIKNADYTNEDGNVNLDFQMAEVNGVKYARMKQANATANAIGNGALRGLTYTDEAFYQWEDNRTYHYFKYEPVKWRVLEVSGDSLLLMADNAVDCQRYSSNTEKYTWSDSPMRVWLNGYSQKAANGYTCAGGGFINTAFSKDEQADIIESDIHTEDNTLWGNNIPGGKDVQDKVFLLSAAETVNESYGFAPDAMTLSSTRRLQPTDYAFAMGTWLGTYNKYYGNCWWMLRTSGDYAQKMALIYRTGQVYKEGYYVNTPYYGVVPALRVKASSEYVMTEEEYNKKYPSVTIVYGDADGDGKVTLTDASAALKAALGIDKADDTLTKTLDVDGNGKLELTDVTYVLKYALGIISKFPAEEATTTLSVVAQAVEEAEQTHIKEAEDVEVPEYTHYPASGRVWLAADSIAAQHDNNTNLAASSLTVKTRDTLGWGVIFNNYFKDGNYRRFEEGQVIDTQFAKNTTDSAVVINNTALSSRSSKSFTAEKNYGALTDGIGQGDYLLISFGHNDEYPQVERYTDPYGDSSTEGSYKWYLKTKFIDPALEAGATPVLISSVVKRNYVDGVYQPQFHEAYATAMKELSEEYAKLGITIPYIDLHHKMDALYKTLSDDESKLLHASYDVAEFNDEGQEEMIKLLGATAELKDEREAQAKAALKLLSVDEVKALVAKAAEEKNSLGVSYINEETSGSYMDNVHFTYAGARYAAKYILEGLKDANLDLYSLTDEDAVKTLDEINTSASFKESEIYKNVH